MTDDHQPTTDERIAQHQAREDDLRAALADADLDGPFDFPSGGGLFGGLPFTSPARNRFAICLRCGALVALNDPEERPDGPPIERGVRIHTTWHLEVGR